jgi:hypothetical protein
MISKNGETKMNQVQLFFGEPLQIAVTHTYKPTYRAVWTWQIGSLIFKGEHMASTMQAGTSAQATVTWIDQFGNPAKIDGATQWASSDDTVLTVSSIPGPPENRAKVDAVGPIGPAQLQATADADLGQGVQSITAILDVTVIAGQASAGTIELDNTPAPEPVSARKR